MVQSILFNSIRTLYDSEKQTLFPGTEKTLQILSKLYSLIIVSLVSDESIEKTLQILCRCGIEKYFAGVYFDQKNKEKLYTLVLTHLQLEAREVAIVDDQIIQSLQWGNSYGATNHLVKAKHAYRRSERRNWETNIHYFQRRRIMLASSFISCGSKEQMKT